MKITQEEKLMYQVMRAIFESRIPIDFKGAMVLHAYLYENGFTNDVRRTMDIDANWLSDAAPTEEQMVQALQNALDQAGIELKVSLYRMYGEGRSAGFEFSDPEFGDVLFTMDMDVNRPAAETKLYTIDGFTFRGVVVEQMLADKICAVSSEKVFRRIKDIVDLYYLSQCASFDPDKVVKAIKNAGRTLGSFDGLLTKHEDLRHAYEKFRFGSSVQKPPFEDVYSRVCSFADPFVLR